MDQKDIPVLALAAEHRGEARSLKRGLGAAVLGIVGFGLLYLVPYVGLLGEERGLVSEEEELGASLASAEARRRSLEEAHDLLIDYEELLGERSRALAEEAKASVRNLNELLAFVADPPDLDDMQHRAQANEPMGNVMQAQTPNSPGDPGEAMNEWPFGELYTRYGLGDSDIQVLLAGKRADPVRWQAVADGVLERVMTESKERLRSEARDAADSLAADMAALDPPISGDLDDGALAAATVVPDDEAPAITATPRTTGGKEAIMETEFQHIRIPAAELDAQVGFRLDDVAASAGHLEDRYLDLAARVEAITLEKAELEDSMERTAAELEDFALPFGVLEWNSARLIRWFPLIAGLTLLWFASAAARLDRRRSAIRAHLAALPEHDRTLLCGPRVQPIYALALVLAGGFVVWLQRATGAASDGPLLIVVGAVCVLAAVVAARPLLGGGT
jgi:hypothetical protein